MKVLVLFLGLLIGSTTIAQSFQNVGSTSTRCTKGDCFTHGWHTNGPNTRLRVECTDGDCLNEGWVVTDILNRNQTEIVCKRNGCFNQGWSEYVTYSGRRVGQVSCFSGELDDGTEEQNCLAYGWVLNPINGPQQRVSCIDEDCEQNGWSIYIGYRHVGETVCTSGSCFEEGWRSFY
jgi:hypothetical protein